MRRIGMVFLVSLAFISLAKAQERTMKPDAPGTLRVWPQIGHWQTVLFRGTKGENDLICLLGTAVKNKSGSFDYLWGIMGRKNIVSLVIVDKDKIAVSGNNISVIIDGIPVGSYPITKSHSTNNHKFIISDLSNSSSSRIESLFASGGRVEFKTAEAQYTASLEGAGVGINNFRECLNEISEISK